jgi:hypothetical protein
MGTNLLVHLQTVIEGVGYGDAGDENNLRFGKRDKYNPLPIDCPFRAA